MTRGGLPHSEIPGSKLICSSPGLIAACHVLHRLLAPRHSPYTLSSLTIRNSELTIIGVLAYTPIGVSPYANTACLWSEKTTVCRIFNCQRSHTTWEPTPPRPRFGRSWGPTPHSASSPRASPQHSSREKSVYVGRRLGALLMLQRSLLTVSQQQPTNEADVDCSEPEGPATQPKLFKEHVGASCDRHQNPSSGPPSRSRASAWQPSLACPAVAPQGAKAGGEYRARTGDLLVANQALSQLS